MSSFFTRGKKSLQINTDTSLFRVLEWSAVNNEYRAMLILLSSFDILGSRKVLAKRTTSKLLVAIYAFFHGNLIKSWAASPFKFQRKNFKQDYFFKRGLV